MVARSSVLMQTVVKQNDGSTNPAERRGLDPDAVEINARIAAPATELESQTQVADPLAGLQIILEESRLQQRRTE